MGELFWKLLSGGDTGSLGYSSCRITGSVQGLDWSAVDNILFRV